MTFLTFIPPRPPAPGTMNQPTMKLRKADFGDGYTQVTPDGMNHVRQKLTLSWEDLTPDEAKQITGFLKAQGGYTPFYYTPSDDTTQKKWTCEEYSDKRGTSGFRTVSATFIQSFNLGG